MPPKNTPVEIRPRRMLELFAVALAIPLGVAALLTGYSHFFGGGAVWPEELRPVIEPQGPPDEAQLREILAQRRAEQAQGLVMVAPNEPPAADARAPLRPGDEFFRELRADVIASPGYGTRGDGQPLEQAARRFLRHGDVLARRVTAVDEYSAGWSLFGGKHDASWQEMTEWCLRLRFTSGEEAEYSQMLWHLGEEASAHALGIPLADRRMHADAPTRLTHIDPHPLQNLLLPVLVIRSGPGSYGAVVRQSSWQLRPESDICARARAQAGAAVAR